MIIMKSMVSSNYRRLFMNKKSARKLAVAGGGNIAIGVILLVCGIVLGVLSIVNGAMVLTSRKEMEI